MPIKLERKMDSSHCFYEVMLSPFEDMVQIKDYLNKYACAYPLQDLTYKITYQDDHSVSCNDS